ncbi:MAG: alpha-amylase family protein [Chloroflexota bacterium]
MFEVWFKNAVIYCLDVETYADSNGDGVGDFAGLSERLDYLTGLGVTCIWLLPFFPSPNRDNGYDISNYYDVDSRFGHLGDFVEFTQKARDRGIRVILDLVVNHTSNQHPWFQAARSDPKSPYRDYYIWSESEPKDARQGVVFPGVQDAIWTYDKQAKAYYHHRFYDFQPDLNMANPKVREEIRKVMGFWLELGISGFRVDAAPFLIDQEGAQAHPDENPYRYLTDMRSFLSWRSPDAILLAEANVTMDKVLKYFGDGTRFHMIFNFYLNQHLFLSLAKQDAGPIREAIAAAPPLPDLSQWGNFLRNHDELDLGRLAEAEREQVFEQFGPDPKMQLYDRGIRRRFLPMMGGDERRAMMAFSLMFSLPGTPVIWYGDEIGMGDDLTQKERQAVRTPMQWNPDENGGFSTASPKDVVRSVISKGEYGYQKRNVMHQRRDPNSMLNRLERLIRMRKECPEFGYGQIAVLPSTDPAVLAHCCATSSGTLVGVHNLSDQPKKTRLDVTDHGAKSIVEILGDHPYEVRKGAAHDLELEPYGFRWFRLGDDIP